MQTTPIRTKQVTMPWGGGQTYNQEQQEIAREVREEIQDAYSTARETLARSEKWEPGWTFDQDPSPARVERTSDEYGQRRSVVAESADPTGKSTSPSFLKTESGGSTLEARWSDGQLTSLKSSLESDIGSADLSIEINPETGTLTYSSTKTGEFAVVREKTVPTDYGSGGYDRSESGPYVGPDGVYNEWDNSNRGGGPDSVYNEWDNGRGSYYDGPDGRHSYDPY